MIDKPQLSTPNRTAEFEQAWAKYMSERQVFPPAEAMFYAGWEAGMSRGLKLAEPKGALMKASAMDEGVD